MTRNIVSPSFEGTTPTMTPSSTHTSPTVVDPHSPSGRETTLTKGAFSCIVQECANRVSTEFTICDVCHGRATTMFQEMRKFVSVSRRSSMVLFAFFGSCFAWGTRKVVSLYRHQQRERGVSLVIALEGCWYSRTKHLSSFCRRTVLLLPHTRVRHSSPPLSFFHTTSLFCNPITHQSRYVY